MFRRGIVGEIMAWARRLSGKSSGETDAIGLQPAE
jgi:hypothetical protein